MRLNSDERVAHMQTGSTGIDITDPNVASVIHRIAVRAQIGLAKYRVDTSQTDLMTEDWLTHLQNRLLDAAIYIEAIKAELTRDRM